MYKDNQDRIDAYLRGEMDAESRIQFEEEQKSDKVLNEEFRATKAISDAIANRKEKLDQMACWDEEENLRRKRLYKKMILRRWTIGVSAAACIAIGFFAVRPMFMMTSTNSEFVMPDFCDEVYYRGGNNSLAYLDSLISAQDYEQALVCVNSLISDYNDELRHYEVTDSLTEKESYNKDQCKDGLDDLAWRRANLLVALGRTNEAKECLKQIVEGNGIFKEPADALLKKLPHE